MGACGSAGPGASRGCGGSVIKELQYAEQLTRDNDTLTLTMCINYGGRVELVDAMRAIAEDVKAGRTRPGAITEKLIRRHLYIPDMPDVDLFLRSSGGEQRTSNFLLWQSAYAEMVFLDTLWPDFSREELWRAIGIYLSRDRRFGGAWTRPTPSTRPDPGGSSAVGVIPGPPDPKRCAPPALPDVSLHEARSGGGGGIVSAADRRHPRHSGVEAAGAARSAHHLDRAARTRPSCAG